MISEQVLLDTCSFIRYNDFTRTVKRGDTMKQDFTEEQYVQMAKEQFCKSLKEVPFVEDIEMNPTGLHRGFGDFHVVAHFADSQKPSHFFVEVKANGERRYVNSFMFLASQHHDDACYVFMAPYISEASAEILRERKYSYMDLSGNCYISSRRILMHISGKPNQYIQKREMKNYFVKSSGAASAIMRTMLNSPEQQWQVKKLAEITGKAIGTVSNVKSFLLDKAWITELPRGFELCNIREMLYEWAKDYHKKDARVYEYYSLDSVADLEQAIAEWTVSHDNGATLGGFSAAARYAPTVRYKRVDVYVESQFFDEFVKDMDLSPVESGGNVRITIPHDNKPCMFAKTINGALVTSPVQTVLDLLDHAGRGEEAADAIIDKEYKGRA